MAAMDPFVESFKARVEEYESRFVTSTSPSPTPDTAQQQFWADRDIRSFTRVRPVLPCELPRQGSHRAVSVVSDRSPSMRPAAPFVAVHEVSAGVHGLRAVAPKEFRTDYAFGPESTNSAVYSRVVAPLVRLAAGGATSAVVAFGQTGSGKTFTMTAMLESAASDLFAWKSATQSILVTVIEILGADTADLTSRSRVEVSEDRFGSIVLRGAAETHVQSAAELHSVLNRALEHRLTRGTERNQSGSSRSHAITRIRVAETDPAKLAAGAGGDGLLFLVDLAGSERAADRKNHTAEALAEAKLINASLMALKECIRARSCGNAGGGGRHRHVPYRTSKLTLVLRDSFELAVARPSKLAVIACVSPLACDASHSVNTLRYATDIMVAPSATVVVREKNDPLGWSGDEARAWLAENSRGDLDPNRVLQGAADNGRTLAELPEAEFIARATGKPGDAGVLSLVRAHKMYSALWALVADARSERRKRADEQRDRIAARKAKEAADDLEMVKRLCH